MAAMRAQQLSQQTWNMAGVSGMSSQVGNHQMLRRSNMIGDQTMSARKAQRQRGARRPAESMRTIPAIEYDSPPRVMNAQHAQSNGQTSAAPIAGHAARL